MTTRPVRLLHTSDVHIGGGFRTPEHGDHLDHCLCPLDAIERSVATEQVDAMLVVGDLFDNKRIDDDLVKTVLHRLGGLGVPCVLIAGNHDVHDDTSLYGPGRVDAVVDSNVIFLDDPAGTTVELFGGALHLWGKAMPVHDRTFRPLADVPARPRPDGWWVVLGHGHYEPADLGAMGRSSPLTPADIEATAADYVALGHWHVRTDVSTGSVPAWYSGAPYGVAASEAFNLIDLHPHHGVSVRPVDVSLTPTGCA